MNFNIVLLFSVGFHEAAILLLTEGANPGVEDDFHTTCLERALKSNHVICSDLADLLISGIIRRSNSGVLEAVYCDRLFFMAIQGGHIEVQKIYEHVIRRSICYLFNTCKRISLLLKICIT